MRACMRVCMERNERGREERREYLTMCTAACCHTYSLLPLPQPLVGHNMLLDLAYMFQKFHHDLPPSYCQFKEELHQMFPIIIDTKQLCFSLRQVRGLLCVAAWCVVCGAAWCVVCGVCWCMVCVVHGVC